MYGIIHKEIFESTLMAEGYEVAYVFMSMISLADDQDCVRFAVSSFALRINMPQEKVEHAIIRLSLPDPDSDSPDLEGRRIIALKEIDTEQGRGWFVVNREKYIAKASKQRRRIYMRDLMREKRGKANSHGSNDNKSIDVSSELAHIDIDVDIDINKTKPLSSKLDSTPKKHFKKDAKNILAFLNEKTGRRYPTVDSNIDLIICRLKEGYTVTQMRQVIAKKVRDWGQDDKMKDYTRPKTLFNKTNLGNYAGELGS